MGLRRYSVALTCLVLVGLAPAPSAGEAVRPEASRLVAKYDAGLAGISLGDFKVTATFAGNTYQMKAHGEFSLLAGLLYKATGKTASNGTLADSAPRPARFNLEYADTKKHQRRRITFARGAVSDISIVPKKRRHRRAVPVTAEQLQGVLDPLTAAFLSVRSDAPAGDLSVCNQTIPVFEGKQRFDITLSAKRSERVGKAFSGRAAVCRVHYEPVSGHRPDHPGVQFLSKNEDIEVWLVRVPETEFHVPYKILVPTAWGTGSVTLTGLKVKRGQLQRASAP